MKKCNVKKDINSQLDELFEEWIKSIDNRPFVRDGLMLKYDESIDVEKKWINSEKRIAFLLKDQNQDANEDKRWSEDIRGWLRSEDNTTSRDVSTKFIKNIANVFYGLKNIGYEDYEQVWFGELKNDKVREHFNREAFALVECKKEPGSSRITDSVLKKHINRDFLFLQKEIEILNPNIIVCCGRPIFDFVIKMFSRDGLCEYGINGNLRFCKEKNTIIMYSGHPSGRGSQRNFHDIFLQLYRDFILTEDGKYFLHVSKKGPSPPV